MQAFQDTGLREALRRRQAAMPPLPDDFDAKVLAAYEQQQRRRKVRRLIVWPSIAAAATIALLLVLNLGRGLQQQPALAQETPQMEQAKPQADNMAPSNTDKTASMTHELVNNYGKKTERPTPIPSLAEESVDADSYYGTGEITPLLAKEEQGEGLDVQPEEQAASIPEPLMAANEEIAQPEEEMPIYNEADLPITNMENYLYSKDELKKIEQLRKERLIADIKSTVERARYRLEEIEKSFAQN